MKSINIIGAFDRYNYGDLLFPILIEEYLKLYKEKVLKEYELKYYGLVESDLSVIKGKKTEALKDLYSTKFDEGSLVIVSGGDVLPAKIGNMYIDLAQNYTEMFIKKVIRKLSINDKFEVMAKRKLEVDNFFPWVISEKEIKGCKVLYNAVGGSTLNKLSEKERVFIKEKLKKATYISVRENESRNNLKEFDVNIAPDSATLMSEIFPIKKLEDMVREEVKNFVGNTSSYVTIQSNNASLKDGKDKVLAREIDNLKAKYDKTILMLPIGFAANHDDNIAIRKIINNLGCEVTYFNDLDIYEIMYLIANSEFFAGTSLHGNITAMSYSVRHIGLNRDITKLDKYLKYWDIEGQNSCIDFSELSQRYEEVMEIEIKDLEGKREELINLVKVNFERMFKSSGIE